MSQRLRICFTKDLAISSGSSASTRTGIQSTSSWSAAIAMTSVRWVSASL